MRTTRKQKQKKEELLIIPAVALHNLIQASVNLMDQYSLIIKRISKEHTKCIRKEDGRRGSTVKTN